MMKIERKHIIVGALAIVSVALAGLYWQYTKIMKYCISFKGLKLKSIGLGKIDFDLFLNFMNKSDLNFTIKSQEYTAYLNDVKVANVKNNLGVEIKANSTNVIPLNVVISTQNVKNLLATNLLNIVKDTSSGKIKVDIKLKVSIYGITFSIPYVYESTIKELSAPAPANQASTSMICK